MKRSDNPDGKNLSVFQIQLNQSFSVQGGSQFLVVYSEEIECGLVFQSSNVVMVSWPIQVVDINSSR